MLYPLTFHPVFMERVWGGCNLERLFDKRLPEGKRIGESWEIADRPEAISVVANGPLVGRDLRWLMQNHRAGILGSARDAGGRFPLLLKILDADDDLSLQVHPPAAVARRLGGEPKTEMWYITHTRPGARLFVGLRKGVTRPDFERRLSEGRVADCFHAVETKPDDVMFLPSGRAHAIGGGNVLFEIQQNSDTTYRVFDWNRTGLDGRPRSLQIQESLACIDFEDQEPAARHVVAPDVGDRRPTLTQIVDDPLFSVEVADAPTPSKFEIRNGTPEILAVVRGGVVLEAGGERVNLRSGGFCLLPASLAHPRLQASEGTRFLRIHPG